MRVVSSHGELFSTALTRTSIGFFPVRRLIISKACFTMFVVLAFLPEFLPGRMRPFIMRSTMLTFALRKRWCSCLPLLWGGVMGVRFRYRCKPMSLTWASLKLHFWKSLISYAVFCLVLMVRVTVRVSVFFHKRARLGIRR